MSKVKRVAKKEFRYNYRKGHTNYVFQQVGSKYNSIGLTTNDTYKGIKNMPLKENPQPTKKGTPSYIRSGIITNNIKVYENKPKRNWRFSEEDFKNVKAKIRNYKKILKRNKKNKTR